MPTAVKISPRDMLAIHKATWDMPTLAEKHPEIVEHLGANYWVDTDMSLQVIVRYIGDHPRAGQAEHMGTADVREVVETLLEREVAGR